ncbi:MAG: hypothetical protein MJZ19_05205 [Paludibacteraceae bacterium]|nr:hypothetical protein [Paludibacteraceae bacterium]
MEKIDIVLKALLETKELVSILSYKIDNLEAKIDKLEIMLDSKTSYEGSSSVKEEIAVSKQEKETEKAADEGSPVEETNEVPYQESDMQSSDEFEPMDEPDIDLGDPVMEDPDFNQSNLEQDNEEEYDDEPDYTNKVEKEYSSEEIAEIVRKEKEKIFANNSINKKKMEESLQKLVEEKKGVSVKTNETLQQIKNKQNSVQGFESLKYKF